MTTNASLSGPPTRVRARIEQHQLEGRKAFVPFVVAGDPDLAFTAEAIHCLSDAGSTICEIGFPYSDPIADGPVIQAAYSRALGKGIRIDGILQMLDRVTANISMPCVGMVSSAIIRRIGTLEFLKQVVQVRLAGLIVPDLPLEEAEDFAGQCRLHGIAWNPLVTPTTTSERQIKIAQWATGFIYYVAVTGITGERATLASGLGPRLAELRRMVPTPVCVGFGISTPQQAAEVAFLADGVIVGSAIVRRIAEATSPRQALTDLATLSREFVSALRS